MCLKLHMGKCRLPEPFESAIVYSTDLLVHYLTCNLVKEHSCTRDSVRESILPWCSVDCSLSQNNTGLREIRAVKSSINFPGSACLVDTKSTKRKVSKVYSKIQQEKRSKRDWSAGSES